METGKFKELITSIDEATKALKKLNETLEEELNKCKYTEDEKQNFIDCVRAYCLVHGIRARVADVDSDHTYFYYHYMNERPIRCNWNELECCTTIYWNEVEELDACLDSVLDYILKHVVTQK